MLPYSSVTRAMCAPCRLNSSSTLGAGMVSGTNTGGWRLACRSSGWPVIAWTSRSFARTMPMTFSGSCWMTGNRDRWLAASFRRMSAGGSSTSSHTIRVRGVISMPAVRSPEVQHAFEHLLLDFFEHAALGPLVDQDLQFFGRDDGIL